MAFYGQQQMYQGQQQQMYQGQQQQMPYQQQYQQYQQPSEQYGRYGGFFQQNVFSVDAWQAFQFGSQDELWHVFNMEMSKNPANVERQALQAEDLCNVMNNCQQIRNHFRNEKFPWSWSRELCSIMLAMLDTSTLDRNRLLLPLCGSIMIAMLDRSTDGFMQWQEFMELQQCLVAWHRVFCQRDANGSGFIEANELVQITKDLFGYNLTPKCIETILKRYSRVVSVGPGSARCLIAFDDFVSVCVRLRAYTDAFRKRDGMQHGGETGNCTFTYDDFLRCVMCL